MYGGRIVESGTVRRIFSKPQHPYTVGLLESVPKLGVKRKRLHQIEGQPLSLMKLPRGCPFYDRCSIRMDVCRDHYPEATPVENDGYVHCWARGATAPAASPAESQVS
jgi:oligopeptide/dipeptide ABC transporter ATP-binding protein